MHSYMVFHQACDLPILLIATRIFSMKHLDIFSKCEEFPIAHSCKFYDHHNELVMLLVNYAQANEVVTKYKSFANF